LPQALWITVAVLAGLQTLYLGVLAASYYSGRNLLPSA